MNENLKNAIDDFLKNQDAQSEQILISELKKAEFLAPVIINQALAKPDGSAVYEEEGSNIKFILLEDEDAKLSYFPAFTDRSEMMKWRSDSEQEAINLRLKDYLSMIKNSKEKYAGIVIDAYSYSFILNLYTIESICEI